MHPLIRGLAGLALAFGLVAARAGGSPLEVQFRSVTVPLNSVPTVAQDRAGFIWVATARGLTRYDGYRLRPIELAREAPSQRSLGWVRALAPGADGRMWIGTEILGLAAYDPEQDRVETFGSPAGGGGPHSPIRALATAADGAVWVGTVGQGLYRWLPASKRFEAQALDVDGRPEQRVLALQIGADGTVWAGHWQGLSRLRPGGRWEALALPAEGGLPASATVLALAEGRGGRVWLGTQDGRLGVVEGERVRWLQALGTPVQALAEAVDGRLWVGTKTGLLWVNPSDGAVEARLTHDPRRVMGLAGNDISRLLRDHSGAMWVSGYGLGLQRHLFHPALAVRGPDLEPGSPLADADVRAVLTLRQGGHAGEVLGATQHGQVVRLDGRRELQTLGVFPRERGTVVEIMTEAGDGSLWMAAAGRLEHRAASGRLLRDWALDGGRAQRLLVRTGGEVWVGTQEGLYRLAGPEAAALERVGLADGRPLHGGIHALVEAPGSELWLGGQQGFFRVRAGQGRPEAVPQAPGEALASPIVVGLLWGRDGSLWVDTAVGGLHRLRGWDAEGRARFERVSERLGLEGSFGGNLHEDGQGRIWSQINVYDPRSGRVDSFGSAEGASFGSYWFFASTELPGGGLLFGGSRGLLRVLPEAFAAAPASPPLVISALRVNGQPYSPAALHPGLRLPAGTRSLGVEFAALDFADPARLRYQYRLVGLDNDWTSADASARNPSFGPLRPGRYTLQVRATAHQTLWGAGQLQLPVELLPAWWETAWARAAGVLLALAAIWAWMRWRTRSLRLREAELRALVDERTAELRELSLTDALTGLRNRRYLELRLDDDLRLCLRRFEQPGYEGTGDGPGPAADLLLMLLDLDHFKRINDEHGHAAGDAVLVQLADRLRSVFRDTDSLVRWGGEEILVLVRETERRDAAELAARVCAAVRDRPFDIGPGASVKVSVSIGFSAFPLDPRQPRLWDWRACLGLADSALYAAKAQGRDGYVGAVSARGLSPREAPGGPDGWLRETRLDVVRSTVGDGALSPA
ncbi:ligand-binding sensor domain-containing diguanylate cyclase [Roseateles saccharophilus]|uniref:diguanylate cyclase n=1 Tax=Roseateles saccharophilus TaxID=304 RepID=A0A4R3VAT0_ROSSA|nr:ligand-binding sensor domain-containing diguanylate cyclase [Roseateles saccharophilus]MDG0831702.1 GGDEF domain-containing protein [Roseateles saccharophilus]TCV00883.1 diguanylate cyclase (GGDEF)-like protein [Roseateles saccharophilus]